MFEDVVVPAEQFEVPEGGGSSVGPVPDVVDVTPSRRAVTAGMGAMPVAGDHRPSHRGGYHPGGPADVDRFTGGSEHDPADRAVTTDPADVFGGEDFRRGAVGERVSVRVGGSRFQLDQPHPHPQGHRRSRLDDRPRRQTLKTQLSGTSDIRFLGGQSAISRPWFGQLRSPSGDRRRRPGERGADESGRSPWRGGRALPGGRDLPITVQNGESVRVTPRSSTAQRYDDSLR